MKPLKGGAQMKLGKRLIKFLTLLAVLWMQGYRDAEAAKLEQEQI